MADKSNNKYGLITVIFVAVCLLVFPISLILMPKKDFSENENRNLAPFPEITVKNITSGKFMDDINEYVTDHFPGRDFWISLKTSSEIILRKDVINGIYIADDNYLIGDYPEPVNTEKNKDILKRFNASLLSKNEKLNVRLMLVPTSITINSDMLPKGTLNANQLVTINEITSHAGIETVDVYNILMEHKDQQLFYRTDHHWTTLGAYYAYLEYCENLGFTPVSLSDLEANTVTSDFHGTYSSKVNRLGEKGDEIVIYTNPLDKLTVNYTDSDEITDSLYELSYIDKKDKYSLFLNNLHTLIEISNDNAETDRVLMLVKDSYANSIVPFLVRHYKKIYVFDTRYYKYGPSAFVEEHPEITDVLILYNLGTMDTDTGIRGIF